MQSQLATLLHRLLHLATQTPQFIPILQSTAFRPEEALVQAQLDGVNSELEGRGKPIMNGSVGGGVVGVNNGATRRGGGEGRMIGQVNDLWGQVETIRQRRKINAGGREGWLGDEKALAEVAEVGNRNEYGMETC